MNSERNRLLLLSDRELAAECRLDFYKATGNGGQKRNKTSSAVRIIHPASGIAVTDCAERSQHRNRAAALDKLRLALALALREAPEGEPLPPECAISSAGYPLWLARLFDVLADCGYDPAATADVLHWSKSHLIRQLSRSPEVWQAFTACRNAAGLPFLHP